MMNTLFVAKDIEFEYGGRILKTTVIADAMTHALHGAASSYLLSLALARKSDNTIRKYASHIKSLINEMANDPDISGFDDVTDVMMSVYLESVLMDERKNTASTIIQVQQTLTGFFEYLKDQGFAQKEHRFTYALTMEAELKLAKTKGSQNSHDPFKLSERYIPQNQFDLFMKYVDGKTPYIKDRNEIMMRLAYEAGCRRHEITWFKNFSLLEIEAAIKKSERDNLNEIYLNIFGKGRKMRKICIEPQLRRKIEEFIRRYKHLLNGQLICSASGQELTNEYAARIFIRAKKKLIKEASLEDADRWESNTGWTFHALRHSYATNLGLRIESGEAKLGRSYLMDRLGHNHPQTTLIYLHFAAALLGRLREADKYESEMRAKSFVYDREEFAE
jgi:site-specific recombinase XerD